MEGSPSPAELEKVASNDKEEESPVRRVSSAQRIAHAVQKLQWHGPNDPHNPKNFSKARKWAITGVAILGTLIIPMNGTSITVATNQISDRFNVSNDPFPNSYWTVTSWTLGGALFVVIGIPIMEDLGVRRGFFIFYALFFLMIIPQVSTTINLCWLFKQYVDRTLTVR